MFVPYFPVRQLPEGPIHQIADRHRVTPAQVALAWLLRRSPAVLPIPGTLSVDHLRENLRALDIELDDQEFAALR